MKFIFVVSDFDQGGITSSLINLTNKLIEKGHTIHILNLPNYESLPSNFNQNIKLIMLDKKAKLFNIHITDFKNAKGLKKIKYLYLGIWKKIFGSRWNKICFSKMKFDDDYDAAIGFRQGPTNYYIAKYVIPSKYSIGFNHCDGISDGDTSRWDKCHRYMDKIIAVSNAARDNLLLKYPYLQNKIYTVYNIVKEQEKNNVKKNTKCLNSFNIVTVGRIDLQNQKRQDRIIEIALMLKSDGINFMWTIVGGGPDLPSLKKLINDKDLNNVIECTGSKDNPYPFMKSADLFVSTSVWESYGMVISESLMLHIPVVAGFYPALPEVLDSKYGILTENTVDGIYHAVKKMIVDKRFYETVKSNCMKYNYDSDLPYQQFMELFND